MTCSPRHIIRILLLGLPLCLPAAIHAQEGYRETEGLTYRLYLEQDWDSLITAGHKAIRKGTDYYFLRNRMGIAYDARGQYVRSAWQYEKAIELNGLDPFAVEKRYAALLNCNRLHEARALETRMTDAQKELLTSEAPVVSAISANLGYGINNAYEKIGTKNLPGPESLYGETDLYGDYYYANFAVSVNVTRRFTLTGAYTYLNFAKRKYIGYSYVIDHLDSTIHYDWGYENKYSFPRVSESYAFDYSLVQHEYYLGGTVVLDKGVKLFPSFRMVGAGYNTTYAEYASAVVQDTSYYVSAINTYYTFPFTRSRYSITQSDTAWYNFLFSLAATRDFDLCTIGMSGSWSNFNNSDQVQAGMFVTWYPLGNLDLYGTTGLTMLSQDGDGRMLYSQMVGGKVTRWLWAEGDLVYGDLSNSNAQNGQVVYNNAERIRYRLGSRLIFTLLRDLEFSLNYHFFEKESPIYSYTLAGRGRNRVPVNETTWHRSQTHNIFVGITVKL